MRRAAALAAGAAFAALAQAAEFRSVSEHGAVLFDAPSRAAKPVYVVSRHYPLEVIVNLEAWVKVRDHAGALSWIERKALSEKRMLIVVVPVATARARAEEASPSAFRAQENVVLELVDAPAGGWVHVRHADGSAGYVRANEVWGL